MSIKIITDNDLCVSCGACSHICPFNNIVMQFNDYRGKWEAHVQNSVTCHKCSERSSCLSVCPNYNIDYVSLADSNKNNMLGRIKGVYNGFSKDETIRYSASSGGFIRELCMSLLEKQRINGIISITHDHDLEYSPKIVTDINVMPNSIYHNINFQNALSLLKEGAGRYIVIGLPCQITSIVLFMRKKKYEYIREKIYATISLMCGYTFDRKNALAFSHYNKFHLNEITYREKGRYRKTKLKNSKSQELLFDVQNPHNIHEKLCNMMLFDPYLPQPACLYCVDHMCFCADIVVGDAWQKRYGNDDIGTNLIVSRTERGEEIISQMNSFQFETGYIHEIIEAQSPTYALATVGEGMKNIRLKKGSFIPERKRTENASEIQVYKLRWRDIIKIKMIKKLLRSEKFKTALFVYYLINIKMIINYFIIKLGKGRKS
jgi:coenzyme F420-reducing hydrogenase beta subunit